MARMAQAAWLGEHSPRNRMDRYDVVCIHTIVGFAPAHAAHFSTTADGKILQSRDTAFQSAANLEGNPRVIAVENEDHGPAFSRWLRRLAARAKRPGLVAPLFLAGVPPLTDAQVWACAQILAWAHDVHGIPLRLCPSSRPGSRGLAYHRQGIDGNFAGFRFPGRVPGGEVWSLSIGKVCPGDRRIAQRPEILALARRILEGDVMLDPEVKHQFAALRARLDRIDRELGVAKKRDTRRAQRLWRQLAVIRGQLDELLRSHQ